MNVEELVAECIEAQHDRLAVRDVLQRAVARGSGLTDSLPEPTPGLTFLHRTDTLTVINVIWPPGVNLFPHDHRMWAAIGIYGGREDNAFFRRTENTIVNSGGKELYEGDVLLLGDDAVHAVSNPARTHTGAIHVYGGDFVETPRSQWDAATLEEAPFTMDALNREFARAEEAFRAAN